MSTTDRYIPGVPCWVDTSQPDPAAAAEFYAGLLGWEVAERMPEGSAESYLMATIGGREVAAISSPIGETPARALWNTYVWVESAEETAARVAPAGGAVLVEPFDVPEAGRMAVCADREGAVFCLWQPARHRGAQVVNEPGSVNFNDLHSRDPEAAREFYAAVFGWELLGEDAFRMWALPGYGEFLERINPGTLQMMADLGAPERFEDVVASLVEIGDEETQPHWGVTFAVADADATATRARELGGTVLLEPADAPWSRATVIADPQGAVLTASQFVPENKDV